MTDAPNNNGNTPASKVFSDTPSQYDGVTGQEAQASDIVAKAQAMNTQTTAYNGGLSGTEAIAKEIVDNARAADNNTIANPNTDKLDLIDGQQANAGSDLNTIAPAAGQPFNSAGAAVGNGLNAGAMMDRSAISHTLAKPAAGQTAVIDVQPGEILQAQFDPNSADLDMKGSDLVMSFNDGSKIVLQGFAEDLSHMPNIALPNGALVAGGVIVAQLQGLHNDIFNLETAAGASGEGGTFIYNDNLGSVIGLLNKLPPIPFTALEFSQPEERVVFNDDFNPATGSFVVSAVGYEDWAANQNVGDYSQVPMALNLNFTPTDNEVVDLVTINNFPAGTQFFYGSPGNYVLVPEVNGSVTFTAAQLAAGNVFIIGPNNSDHDIPMTVTMQIHDTATGFNGVVVQNFVAVVDAVADQPGINATMGVDGQIYSPEHCVQTGEQSHIFFYPDVSFPDKDGSELHTVTFGGIPEAWSMSPMGVRMAMPSEEILMSFKFAGFNYHDVPGGPLSYMNGMFFTTSDNGDGTVTYKFFVPDGTDFTNTVQFFTSEWAGHANITMTATAQEMHTDGEITTANNISTLSTTFCISANEDVPTILAATPGVIFEHDLPIPGIDTVSGTIKVDFHSDGIGEVRLNLDGLNALNLTSHGSPLSYALSADGKTITATDGHGNTIFTIALGQPLIEYGIDTNHIKQTVPYTFTLLGQLDHPLSSVDSFPVPFHFTATDSDGDVTHGQTQVHIVDDVPVANPDVNHINDGDITATGNVLTGENGGPGAGDYVGADQNGTLQQVISGDIAKHFDTPDGIDPVHGAYVVLSGNYGVLKLFQDGSYVYTYNNSSPAGHHTDIFTYVMQDYDGDSSVSTLTIDINDKGPGEAPDIVQTIDETGDLNVVIGGTISVIDATHYDLGTVTGTSGFTSTGSLMNNQLTSHGVPVTVSLVNGQYVGMAGNVVVFTLSINDNGQYSFVQHAALDHANGSDPNDVINLHFYYTATDNDGDASEGHITINVRDDAPDAWDDVNTLDNTLTADGNVITGLNGGPGAADILSQDNNNVLKEVSHGGVTKNFNIPDGIENGLKFILINGDHGVLKIFENGNYTYTYNGGVTSTADEHYSETFQYTLVDGDGDTSQATLQLTINDAGMITPLMICTAVWEGVDDASNHIGGNANVVNATDYHLGGINGAGAFSANGNIAGGTLKSEGVPVTVSFVNGEYVGMAGDRLVFKLTMDGTGHYDFKLYSALDHSGLNSYFDIIDLHFNYTALDNHGNQVEGTIQVRVNDWGPGAANDFRTMTADMAGSTAGISINGNVQDNDSHANLQSQNPGLVWGVGCITFGTAYPGVSWSAPTGTDTHGAFVTVEGKYGWLKMYQDGSYTYSLKEVDADCCLGKVREEFSFVVGDSDGDVAEEHLYIDISFGDSTKPPVITVDADETFDMNHVFTGAINVAGAVDFDAGTVDGHPNFQVSGAMTNGQLSSGGVPITVSIVNGQYVGMAGNNEVFKLTINDDGTYNFVLLRPLDHGVTWSRDEIIDMHFSYTVTMADGTKADSCIQILVADDGMGMGGHFFYVSQANNIVTGNAMNEINHVSADGLVRILGVGAYQGGGSGSFDNPAGQDNIGKFIIVQGLYGYLKFYENGQYEYHLQTTGEPCDNCSKVDMFLSWGIDGDGDQDGLGVLYFSLNEHPQGVTINPGLSTNLALDVDHNFSLLPDVHLGNATHLTEAIVNINGTYLEAYTPGESITMDVHSGYSIVGGHVMFNGVDTGLTMSISGGAYDPLQVHIYGNATTQAYENLLHALDFNTPQSLAGGTRFISIITTDENGHTSGQTTTLSFSTSSGPGDAHNDIPVYHAANNTSINISDLLSGGAYHAGISDVNDFVRIDHTTGHVMVDATGQGHFDPGHYVATVDNVNAFNMINVILNDEEGSKIVHTT